VTENVVWERVIHVWHWFLPMLDEAEQAIQSIGELCRRQIG
jgi:hypothetical protein